jgi:hypothetical protein
MMSDLEWTDEQKKAAFYCAETLRGLLTMDAKLALQILHSRGTNAVVHAEKAGLFGQEPN